jgi:hypothetical protein
MITIFGDFRQFLAKNSQISEKQGKVLWERRQFSWKPLLRPYRYFCLKGKVVSIFFCENIYQIITLRSDVFFYKNSLKIHIPNPTHILSISVKKKPNCWATYVNLKDANLSKKLPKLQQFTQSEVVVMITIFRRFSTVFAEKTGTQCYQQIFAKHNKCRSPCLCVNWQSIGKDFVSTSAQKYIECFNLFLKKRNGHACVVWNPFSEVERHCYPSIRS